jgi:hypothetical protein
MKDTVKLLLWHLLSWFHQPYLRTFVHYEKKDWDEVPDGQHDANNEQGTYPGRHALVLWAVAAAVVTLVVRIGMPEVGRNLAIRLELVPMESLNIHLCAPTFSRSVDSFSGGLSLCVF